MILFQDANYIFGVMVVFATIITLMCAAVLLGLGLDERNRNYLICSALLSIICTVSFWWLNQVTSI